MFDAVSGNNHVVDGALGPISVGWLTTLEVGELEVWLFERLWDWWSCRGIVVEAKVGLWVKDDAKGGHCVRIVGSVVWCDGRKTVGVISCCEIVGWVVYRRCTVAGCIGSVIWHGVCCRLEKSDEEEDLFETKEVLNGLYGPGTELMWRLGENQKPIGERNILQWLGDRKAIKRFEKWKDHASIRELKTLPGERSRHL